MTVTTENSIQELLSSSDDIMWDELSLITHTLERLFESDEVQISKEELLSAMLKIFEFLERMREAKSPLQKFDIYYYELYKPFVAEIIKTKYSDFLTNDSRQKIEAHEKYMEGVRELLRAMGTISIALEEEDKELQYESLYTGIAELSEIIEKYLIYFPPKLIDALNNIAVAFLNDANLKPERANQNDTVFSCLVRLKNTARAILWQIEEHRTNEKSRLTDSSANQILTCEMQIQKNQAAMDWAKSRLEKIESIAKEKGWSL
ncbi:MAG: hypothetical protein MUE44_33100 [Oscillatoriaceae cyanobacterium Prado104]|jgi:hypothetical protein|nr:hypothetical protein [Oscillatoriaceae cyanobacterium Prado104]